MRNRSALFVAVASRLALLMFAAPGQLLQADEPVATTTTEGGKTTVTIGSSGPTENSPEIGRLLKEGAEALKAGYPKRAISEFVDKALALLESGHQDADTIYYSAHSQSEAFMYAITGAAANKKAVVLDASWSDAYLLKAYALSELADFENARQALNAAIALAPMNPRFHSELAYTYIGEKKWDLAMASYKTAEELADAWSEKDEKKENLGIAWRGQGYVLVELGKLDEAEALYKKCLKLNSRDDKARGELKYIKDLRKKR